MIIVSLLLLLAACGRIPQVNTPASNTSIANTLTREQSSVSSVLREEDCPKPVGMWRGYHLYGESFAVPVAEIFEDGRVTLFRRDLESHTAIPTGDTFTGEWTLLKDLESEEFAKPVSSYYMSSFGVEETTYVWKFHSQDGRSYLGTSETTVYFVLRLGEDWTMVDPDLPDGIVNEFNKTSPVNDIYMNKQDKVFPTLREEDCPKPLDRYQTSVLFYNSNTWEKVTYLDVREDGSVILYYMFDTDMGGIEMKGRWTLWANQEQEGSYGGPGDAWDNWNSTTKYLWRFDSDESYKIPGGETCRIWLLFTFKENGNLWLHHNGMQFQSTYQLRPSD